jgi:6-phosphogluconolactonase/glucosamine-6-phosphate isomerase/deaminase
MFTTLRTRKRKSKRKTKEYLVAEKQHKKWLLSMGIDGKRNRLPPKTLEFSNDLKGQDNKPIHTMGTPCYKKKRFTTTKTYTIAPAYNKGAYQVISKEEVKNIGK